MDKSNLHTTETLTNKNQTLFDGSMLVSYKFHLKPDYMPFTTNSVWNIEDFDKYFRLATLSAFPAIIYVMPLQHTHKCFRITELQNIYSG